MGELLGCLLNVAENKVARSELPLDLNSCAGVVTRSKFAV